MTNTKNEKKDIAGVTTQPDGILDIPEGVANATNKNKEEDILSSLLKASDFRNDEELITPVDIKRGKELIFTFHVRPVSDDEAAFCRKKARKMYPNPAGKKYPKIEGEISGPIFNSWLIYTATADNDKEKIWGHKAFMDKFDILEPWETVGKVLTAGEKSRIVDVITDISGLNDDVEEDMDDYVKNL